MDFNDFYEIFAGTLNPIFNKSHKSHKSHQNCQNVIKPSEIISFNWRKFKNPGARRPWGPGGRQDWSRGASPGPPRALPEAHLTGLRPPLQRHLRPNPQCFTFTGGITPPWYTTLVHHPRYTCPPYPYPAPLTTHSSHSTLLQAVTGACCITVNGVIVTNGSVGSWLSVQWGLDYQFSGVLTNNNS